MIVTCDTLKLVLWFCFVFWLGISPSPQNPSVTWMSGRREETSNYLKPSPEALEAIGLQGLLQTLQNSPVAPSIKSSFTVTHLGSVYQVPDFFF